MGHRHDREPRLHGRRWHGRHSGDGELPRRPVSIPQRTLQLTLQDLIIADTLNNRVQAVESRAAINGAEYVTANDMYTIDGNSDGAMG